MSLKYFCGKRFIIFCFKQIKFCILPWEKLSLCSFLFLIAHFFNDLIKERVEWKLRLNQWSKRSKCELNKARLFRNDGENLSVNSSSVFLRDWISENVVFDISYSGWIYEISWFRLTI